MSIACPCTTTPYLSHLLLSVCLPDTQKTGGKERHLGNFTTNVFYRSRLDILSVFLSLSQEVSSLCVSSSPLPLYFCCFHGLLLFPPPIILSSLSLYSLLHTRPLSSVPRVHLAGCWGLTLKRHWLQLLLLVEYQYLLYTHTHIATYSTYEYTHITTDTQQTPPSTQHPLTHTV